MTKKTWGYGAGRPRGRGGYGTGRRHVRSLLIQSLRSAAAVPALTTLSMMAIATGPKADEARAPAPRPIVLLAQQSGAGGEIVTFNISARSLDDALADFAQTTGWQVGYPAAMTAGKKSPGFTGRTAPAVALDAILAGTRLSFSVIGEKSATLFRLPENSGGGVRELGPVQVTARLFTEDLQDTPVTVRVLGADEIEKSNIEHIQDVLEFTPNVGTGNNGRRQRNNIAIRGITNVIGSGASGDSIGFYVDGVNANPSGGQRGVNQALFDIERVEVLYGPQGTTFGRNTIGGVVNYVSKKPTAETEATVSGTLDTFETKQIRAIANGSLTGDEDLMLRVALFGDRSGGHIRFAADGLGTMEEEETGARIALRSKALDGVVYDLSATFTRYEDNMLQSIRRTSYDQAVRNGDSYYTERGREDINKTLQANVIQAVEADLGWAQLVSNTGFFYLDDNEKGDRDDSALDRLDVDQKQRLLSASQELRLQGFDADWNIPGKVSWTLGMNTSWDFFRSSSDVKAGADAGFLANRYTRSMQDSRVWQIAGFGDIRYRPMERLELSAGARYTEDQVKITRFQASTLGATAYARGTFREVFNGFTPKFTALYEITPDISTYGSIGNGYKSGGINTNGNAFEDERIWNYEVGLKTEFLDRRLRANVAFYYNDWSDFQISVNNGTETQIENAGSATSLGGELGLRYVASDNLVIGLNYGFTDSQVREVRFDSDKNGADMTAAPNHTFSATADYARPVNDRIDWTFRAEFTYRSSSFDSIADAGTKPDLEGYNLLNLRTGLETDSGRIEAFIENVFDTKYITHARPSTVVGGTELLPETVVPGPRRLFGIRGRVDF